ncbi:MAG: cell division protein FtsW [Gemmatimonadaceae bacterium]|jgi:cell division protein FtsW|nr:cell division protein FtsW [Gemmatimonadaceae bacterium]MEA2763708.1 cell division protein FtsW [Gemmatimonadaceae bacterium]
MEASAGVRDRWTMGVEARVLVILTGVLLAFGVATVYSASAIVEMQAGQGHAYLLLRQLTGMAVGAVLFAIAAKLDAELWERWAWPLMALSLVLLIVVILPFTATIAPRIHGSRRYLFGASLQPSELAKLAVVLWTSMLVVKKGPVMRRLTKGLLPFLVVIGALDILVMLEPDLSTAMMFTLVMGIILFTGGVRIGHFVALGVLLIPLLYVKIERLNYVLLRMTAFFDPGGAPPEVSYQLRQSLIAVGSGRIFGVGFGRGRQQYGFLPFGYDDFIAGHIGEEWGFVGLALLVAAFAVYAAVGFRIARKARTPFLQLVAVGLTVTTVLTAYLHIGVATGLLPTTGLTLPFISYGRSNLVLSLLMTGILVNIGSRRERVFGEAATDPLALRALPAR